MYYTGVGARKTPLDILNLMTQIAFKLHKLGYWLRSGGADGADTAFERGALHNKRIFYANDTTKEAMDIAAYFHPAWGRCSIFAKKLHGRNAFQVLGRDLNKPSQLLICWTPDGCITHTGPPGIGRSSNTGGTGTAISIASHYGVPVHNLARLDCLEQWIKWL